MPYQFLPDVATADVAFKAWGATIEELFAAAAEATMNVMVENLDSIADQETRMLELQEETLEMLLFKFLQEFIYYKDAEEFVLRPAHVQVQSNSRGGFFLKCAAYGEKIAPPRHHLNVDVKAVTFHRFYVKETPQGWEAMVVLDI